jgi:hypothetical protein
MAAGSPRVAASAPRLCPPRARHRPVRYRRATMPHRSGCLRLATGGVIDACQERVSLTDLAAYIVWLLPRWPVPSPYLRTG